MIAYEGSIEIDHLFLRYFVDEFQTFLLELASCKLIIVVSNLQLILKYAKNSHHFILWLGRTGNLLCLFIDNLAIRFDIFDFLLTRCILDVKIGYDLSNLSKFLRPAKIFFKDCHLIKLAIFELIFEKVLLVIGRFFN